MIVTPNGAQIKIYNDPANLVEKKILPEQTYAYTYDSQYNLTRTTNSDSDLSFTYDPLSRLTLAQAAGNSISYTYDINSNLASITDPSGVITSYIYDNLNRLTDIQEAGQNISHYNYDALSRRIGKTIPGTSLNTSYNYDLASRLLSITNLPTTINDTYTYDNVGNRLSIADNNGFHNYVYDSVYRLASATNPAENYSYDPVGNRNPLSQTYDSGNRLLDDGNYTYTYDHDGNVTKKVKKGTLETTTYTYNSEDQLIGVVTPTQTISYKYDALGRRIEKNVAGTITRYVYDGEDIIQELDGNNQIVATYTHGPGIDEPICLEKNNQKYYYISDGLGSIKAIVDSNGNIAQSYRYDSFGNILSATGSLNQPYTYTGREYDSETGLFYFRARYYDASTGRFQQEDPIWDTNLYWYVSCNPINLIDPFGLAVLNPHNYPISADVLEALNKFNIYIGVEKDIIITGGNRPASSKLGAGANSTHVIGLAADICVPGQSNLQTANQASDSGLFGGVGWYEEGYRGPHGEGPHVHVDLRKGYARWGYDRYGRYYPGYFPKYKNK
jgi:RHS repeat-associated protein